MSVDRVRVTALVVVVLSLFAVVIRVVVIEGPQAEDRVGAACRAAWDACIDTSVLPDCKTRDRVEGSLRHPWEDTGLCGLIWSECWAGATAKAAGGPWR